MNELRLRVKPLNDEGIVELDGQKFDSVVNFISMYCSLNNTKVEISKKIAHATSSEMKILSKGMEYNVPLQVRFQHYKNDDHYSYKISGNKILGITSWFYISWLIIIAIVVLFFVLPYSHLSFDFGTFLTILLVITIVSLLEFYLRSIGKKQEQAVINLVNSVKNYDTKP